MGIGSVAGAAAGTGALVEQSQDLVHGRGGCYGLRATPQ